MQFNALFLIPDAVFGRFFESIRVKSFLWPQKCQYFKNDLYSVWISWKYQGDIWNILLFAMHSDEIALWKWIIALFFTHMHMCFCFLDRYYQLEKTESKVVKFNEYNLSVKDLLYHIQGNHHLRKESGIFKDKKVSIHLAPFAVTENRIFCGWCAWTVTD